MPYKEFNKPDHVKHLDNTMNKLSEVSSLYSSAMNKNIDPEIKKQFLILYEMIDKEKWTNIKPEFRDQVPSILKKYNL